MYVCALLRKGKIFGFASNGVVVGRSNARVYAHPSRVRRAGQAIVNKGLSDKFLVLDPFRFGSWDITKYGVEG